MFVLDNLFFTRAMFMIEIYMMLFHDKSLGR